MVRGRILVALVLVASACAPRPLRTPPLLPSRQCPSGNARLVGLLGFEGSPELVPLVAHLEGIALIRRQSLRNLAYQTLAPATPRRTLPLFPIPTFLSGASYTRRTKRWSRKSCVPVSDVPLAVPVKLTDCGVPLGSVKVVE